MHFWIKASILTTQNIYNHSKRIAMRTLLRITIDTVTGNKTISDGSLGKLIQSTAEKLKPEATYFHTVDGLRSCFMVFDMKDPSEIPAIAEPLFMGLNAKITFTPVMKMDDLQKGSGAWQNAQGK